MPRLISNPNLDICPDYMSEIYTDARATLSQNNDFTEQQAAQLLESAWQAANNVNKRLWQEQEEGDLRRQEEQSLRDEEERKQQDEAQRREEELTRREEIKKNKHKYIPIPDNDVPTEIPIIPAPYALRKLEKGDFVELWYFTNSGLEDAMNTVVMADDDTMVMSHLPDGSAALITASSSRASRTAIDDQNLSFEDFCQASPRMITAMEEANWPKDRVKMMAFFWRNLQTHPLRSSREPLAQKTLLVYQAEQRKRWHIAIKSTNNLYSLERINEVLLERTRNQVYWDFRDRKDNERDYQVRDSSRLSYETILTLRSHYNSHLSLYNSSISSL